MDNIRMGFSTRFETRLPITVRDFFAWLKGDMSS